MKKIIICALVLSLVATLTACNSDTPDTVETPAAEQGGGVDVPPGEDVGDNGDIENGDSAPDNSLPTVELEGFTVKTSGRLLVGNEDLTFEVGDVIEAYPLEIEDIFTEPRAYDDQYSGEIVVVSGYVYNLKNSGFVLAATPDLEIDGYGDYHDVAVFEQIGLITPENGWDIAEGDHITVLSRTKGRFTADGQSYFVMNFPFLVD